MIARSLRAPRGTSLTCQGWPQEAALRMLMNNLDPEVAERPDELIVYGGTGKAARSWEAFDAIVRSLKSLAHDETLLVQSGKPVGIFKTHPGAPRVLIANANLVPKWATWETFRDLEDRGLTMYGQMTAGSWIYIGSQGILQGTYETLAEVGRRHFGGTLERKDRRHGRARRHGRRPAARGDHERRRRAGDRGRSGPDREAPLYQVPRREHRRRGRGGRNGPALRHGRRGALDRRARQRRRGAAGARRARLHARRDHRSDLGARSAGRLRSRRPVARRRGAAARVGSGRVPAPIDRRDGPARRARCARCRSAARSRSTTATTSARRR